MRNCRSWPERLFSDRKFVPAGKWTAQRPVGVRSLHVHQVSLGGGGGLLPRELFYLKTSCSMSQLLQMRICWLHSLRLNSDQQLQLLFCCQRAEIIFSSETRSASSDENEGKTQQEEAQRRFNTRFFREMKPEPRSQSKDTDRRKIYLHNPSD